MLGVKCSVVVQMQDSASRGLPNNDFVGQEEMARLAEQGGVAVGPRSNPMRMRSAGWNESS
jgi:hypothetical protein